MAHLKYRWREVRPHLVSGLLYFAVRLIGSTVRMQVINEPEDYTKKILCGWHGRTFAFANHFRKKGFWVIISHSRDGEMQTRIFQRLGFRVIRGSTGRGGVKALVEAIRVLKNGGTMAMTPDGPRGPSGVVGEGVMAMAHKSGAQLVPGAFSSSRRWVAKSWDRYTLPKPFSQGVIIYGEPIVVPADASPEQIESARVALQEAMHQLEIEAERMMGHSDASMVRSVQGS